VREIELVGQVGADLAMATGVTILTIKAIALATQFKNVWLNVAAVNKEIAQMVHKTLLME